MIALLAAVRMLAAGVNAECKIMLMPFICSHLGIISPSSSQDSVSQKSGWPLIDGCLSIGLIFEINALHGKVITSTLDFHFLLESHPAYRMQPYVTHEDTQKVGREPGCCRPNSEYPFFLPLDFPVQGSNVCSHGSDLPVAGTGHPGIWPVYLRLLVGLLPGRIAGLKSHEYDIWVYVQQSCCSYVQAQLHSLTM